MLSTAAGRIEVRGDTNASFRISRLPISIFEWISIFGDFQALYESPTRTLTSLAVLVSCLHHCACGRRCCGFISLTDGPNSFQWGGLKASHPGITESIPVRGTPKSSEGDMSPRPPHQIPPWAWFWWCSYRSQSLFMHWKLPSCLQQTVRTGMVLMMQLSITEPLYALKAHHRSHLNQQKDAEQHKYPSPAEMWTMSYWKSATLASRRGFHP